MNALERHLARRILRAAGNPPVRVLFWDDTELSGPGALPVATVHVRDRATLLRVVLDPQIGFPEAFADGAIEVEGSLVRLLTALFSAPRGSGVARFYPQRWLQRLTPNTLRRARQHVAPYELDNRFYALWLDPSMAYTCAYFETPTSSLEEAQRAKMELICRKLALRAGERVVEAGCGWGGLALYMAREFGVKVRACNIARNQLDFARERARRERLQERVEFVEEDYRNLSGRYDAFVSVGMVEHVGRAGLPTLSRVLDHCLAPQGRGLIQVIGKNRAEPTQPWIGSVIFPGSYPPTLRQIAAMLEPARFSILDVENLRMHYALTCEHWLERFEKVAEQVAERFGERLVRTYRMYLASSVATFRTGSHQLFQVLFSRPQLNDRPWTRHHLHAERR